MLRDWSWTGRVMRTVLGGQALLGFFLENAHGSHGTICSSVMVVIAWSFCPGQHFQFFGGRQGYRPFFCVLKVPSEPAQHEIVSMLRPRQVRLQDVSGVPRKSVGGCVGGKLATVKMFIQSRFKQSFLNPNQKFTLSVLKKIRNCLLSSGFFACGLISSRSLNYFVSVWLIIGLNLNHFERIDSYLTLACSSAFQA